MEYTEQQLTDINILFTKLSERGKERIFNEMLLAIHPIVFKGILVTLQINHVK
jgi:hypothetical protein